MIRTNEHGDQKLFRAIELLGPVTAFAAALDGSGQLRKVQHVKLCLWMFLTVVGKRTRHGFRRRQAKVIEIIGARGTREIGFQDTAAVNLAVLGDAFEMILFRRGF